MSVNDKFGTLRRNMNQNEKLMSSNWLNSRSTWNSTTIFLQLKRICLT